MIATAEMWGVVRDELARDLRDREREARELELKIERLKQFLDLAAIRADLQTDMFPYSDCVTVREGILSYFDRHPEPARVTDIVDALIHGGFTTTATRFYASVRMALVRMQENGEAIQIQRHWLPSPQLQLGGFAEDTTTGLPDSPHLLPSTTKG